MDRSNWKTHKEAQREKDILEAHVVDTDTLMQDMHVKGNVVHHRDLVPPKPPDPNVPKRDILGSQKEGSASRKAGDAMIIDGAHPHLAA